MREGPDANEAGTRRDDHAMQGLCIHVLTPPPRWSMKQRCPKQRLARQVIPTRRSGKQRPLDAPAWKTKGAAFLRGQMKPCHKALHMRPHRLSGMSTNRSSLVVWILDGPHLNTFF